MPSSFIRGKYVVARAGADSESSQVITDGAVYQRNGVIEDVGPYDTLKSCYAADEEVGGPGYIVIPGLVTPPIIMAGALPPCKWPLTTMLWKPGFWPVGADAPTTPI